MVGSAVQRTVDLLSAVGSVILVNDDKEQLERDVRFIRYLEEFNGNYLDAWF